MTPHLLTRFCSRLARRSRSIRHARPISLGRRSRPIRPRLVALLCALVAGASVVAGVAFASPASAGTSLRPGAGYRLAGGDFVGYYVTSSGAKVYCLNPLKAEPRTVRLDETARYPGLSASASEALAYAVRTWGNARTRAEAATESQVLNTLAGNTADVRRRAAALPKALRAVVDAHVREARTQHGPYVVRVQLPHGVLPGQSATGTVSVRSATGHGVAGVALALTSSRNATTVPHLRTGRDGTARFTYRAVDTGTVAVWAVASGLAPTRLLVSRPGAGEQRMLSWAAPVSARASAHVTASVTGLANSYSCSSVCDGHPAVTVSACAPASSTASRMLVQVSAAGSTRTAGRLDFAPSRSRVCRSLTLTLSDRETVQGAWQYRTARGWSVAVPAPGRFVIDCPATPQVGVTMSYGCEQTSVMIGLAQPGAGGSWTPVVNSSRSPLVLVVGDLGTTRRITATAGNSAVWTTSARCGEHRTITMQAGIRRANGSWTYGRVASVQTP